MNTLKQRTEKFQELYKQHQASIGDDHQCESCIARREGEVKTVGDNTEHFTELLSLSEEDHYSVIKKITDSQIALAESLRPDPIKSMLQNLLGGAFAGAEVQVMSSDEFFKMQNEAPIVPLNNDGKTHC